MWKLWKKFFAIKKRAYYCREDSTIAFLLVWKCSTEDSTTDSIEGWRGQTSGFDEDWGDYGGYG